LAEFLVKSQILIFFFLGIGFVHPLIFFLTVHLLDASITFFLLSVKTGLEDQIGIVEDAPSFSVGDPLPEHCELLVLEHPTETILQKERLSLRFAHFLGKL